MTVADVYYADIRINHVASFLVDGQGDPLFHMMLNVSRHGLRWLFYLLTRACLVPGDVIRSSLEKKPRAVQRRDKIIWAQTINTLCKMTMLEQGKGQPQFQWWFEKLGPFFNLVHVTRFIEQKDSRID